MAINNPRYCYPQPQHILSTLILINIQLCASNSHDAIFSILNPKEYTWLHYLVISGFIIFSCTCCCLIWYLCKIYHRRQLRRALSSSKTLDRELSHISIPTERRLSTRTISYAKREIPNTPPANALLINAYSSLSTQNRKESQDTNHTTCTQQPLQQPLQHQKSPSIPSVPSDDGSNHPKTPVPLELPYIQDSTFPNSLPNSFPNSPQNYYDNNNNNKENKQRREKINDNGEIVEMIPRQARAIVTTQQGHHVGITHHINVPYMPSSPESSHTQNNRIHSLAPSSMAVEVTKSSMDVDDIDISVQQSQITEEEWKTEHLSTERNLSVGVVNINLNDTPWSFFVVNNNNNNNKNKNQQQIPNMNSSNVHSLPSTTPNAISPITPQDIDNIQRQRNGHFPQSKNLLKANSRSVEEEEMRAKNRTKTRRNKNANKNGNKHNNNYFTQNDNKYYNNNNNINSKNNNSLQVQYAHTIQNTNISVVTVPSPYNHQTVIPEQEQLPANYCGDFIPLKPIRTEPINGNMHRRSQKPINLSMKDIQTMPILDPNIHTETDDTQQAEKGSNDDNSDVDDDDDGDNSDSSTSSGSASDGEDGDDNDDEEEENTTDEETSSEEDEDDSVSTTEEDTDASSTATKNSTMEHIHKKKEKKRNREREKQMNMDLKGHVGKDDESIIKEEEHKMIELKEEDEEEEESLGDNDNDDDKNEYIVHATNWKSKLEQVRRNIANIKKNVSQNDVYQSRSDIMMDHEPQIDTLETTPIDGTTPTPITTTIDTLDNLTLSPPDNRSRANSGSVSNKTSFCNSPKIVTFAPDLVLNKDESDDTVEYMALKPVDIDEEEDDVDQLEQQKSQSHKSNKSHVALDNQPSNNEEDDDDEKELMDFSYRQSMDDVPSQKIASTYHNDDCDDDDDNIESVEHVKFQD